MCVVSENPGFFKNFLLSACVSCNRIIVIVFCDDLLDNVEPGVGEDLNIELQQY